MVKQWLSNGRAELGEFETVKIIIIIIKIIKIIIAVI